MCGVVWGNLSLLTAQYSEFAVCYIGKLFSILNVVVIKKMPRNVDLLLFVKNVL